MKKFIIYKSKIVKLVLISVLSVFLIGSLLTGCASNVNQGTQPDPVVQEPQNNDAVIMDNYKKLIESEAKPQDVFAFLDENAKALSKESTAIIVNDLEKLQNEYLLKLEEKYYENTEIQAALSKIYLAKKDMNDPNNLGTEALKNLINETIKGGYKVETAEGMFFPIVNYSVYKRYSAFLPEDFNAYIELMSVESDKVPAKDAALVIGWDELLQRALKQEAFINKYSDSDKLSEVSKLYDKYKTFVFLGLNNTPLFAYEGNVMVENAKKVYADIDFTTNDSQLKKELKKFMELLKASNYKLTPEIDKFRGQVIGV
ncbi:MAG: hypothetical protein K0S75_2125 [Clostridia bacterium]|jgi:hypothetical protein|nr:hypothetical protein [Clostridia bacterium]